jgi:hypothetical protein
VAVLIRYRALARLERLLVKEFCVLPLPNAMVQRRDVVVQLRRRECAAAFECLASLVVALESLIQGLGFRMCTRRAFKKALEWKYTRACSKVWGLECAELGSWGLGYRIRELGLEIPDLGVGIRGCKSREQFERLGFRV